MTSSQPSSVRSLEGPPSIIGIPRRDATRAALSPREREAIETRRRRRNKSGDRGLARRRAGDREDPSVTGIRKLGASRRAEAVSEAHRQGVL